MTICGHSLKPDGKASKLTYQMDIFLNLIELHDVCKFQKCQSLGQCVTVVQERAIYNIASALSPIPFHVK